MRTHVREFAAAGIPFVFDPGQGVPLFSGDELLEMIDAGASTSPSTTTKRQLLAERTGLVARAIAARVEALVVTRGARRLDDLRGRRRASTIPAVPATALVDPTGCGDAYRAGLLYGIAEGWDWERTGRLASMLGSIKIASRGGQNHSVNRDELAALYYSQFRANLW